MAKPGQSLLPCQSLVLLPELAGSLHCCGQQVRQKDSSIEQIQCKCNFRNLKIKVICDLIFITFGKKKHQCEGKQADVNIRCPE